MVPRQPGWHHCWFAVAMRDVSRLKRQHVGSECGLAVVYVALNRCRPQQGFVSFSHSLESGVEVLGGASAVPRDRSRLLWVQPVHAKAGLMQLAELGGKKQQLAVGEVCLDIVQSKASWQIRKRFEIVRYSTWFCFSLRKQMFFNPA